MTSWADQLHKPSGSWRHGTLWTGAAIVMAAAHAGGLAWLLHEPPIEMADNAPPPAIMIELAPEPEAVDTDENQIAEQVQDSEEIKSETVEPVEKPEETVEQTPPEEVQPEQPVEEMTQAEPVDKIEPEPEIDPIEQEIAKQLENVVVPIPMFRPEPEEKKPVEKPKPKPKKKEVAQKPERKKPAPSSKAETKAAAQVRESNRNAARQTTAGRGFGSVSPAKWQSRLLAHLERRKKYPSGARSRGEQGTAYVRFRIDDNGNVLSASLARSSGFPELDAEVLSLVHRASPVPAPPPGVNHTITAPVRFTVR